MFPSGLLVASRKYSPTSRLSRYKADRLVNSIAKGTPPELVNHRLHQIVAQRKELEQQLANSPIPAPRLLPNLAEMYHQKVRELAVSLARDDAAATRGQLRSLVDAILLIPEGDDLRIEVRGELAAVMMLGAGGRQSETTDMLDQMKMVAVARNHRQLTPPMVLC
jgi:site-specific DNA recombinase